MLTAMVTINPHLVKRPFLSGNLCVSTSGGSTGIARKWKGTGSWFGFVLHSVVLSSY